MQGTRTGFNGIRNVVAPTLVLGTNLLHQVKIARCLANAEAGRRSVISKCRRVPLGGPPRA
eukprot:2739866-Heterocapsa_arctica.AAC.1